MKKKIPMDLDENEWDKNKKKEDNKRETDGINKEKLKELMDVQDKYLRLHAEFDNFRKQMEIEKKREHAKGEIDIITQFIIILDDLEQAEQHMRNNQGLDLITKKIKSIFNKLNVRKLNVLDKKYDPRTCEVVSTIKTTKKDKDEHVAQVLGKGYTYNEYLIRPAMVIVYKFDGERKES